MKLIVADYFLMNQDLPMIEDKEKDTYPKYYKFLKKTSPKLLPNEDSSNIYILFFEKIYGIDLNW